MSLVKTWAAAVLSIMVLCCAQNCSNRSENFILKRFPTDAAQRSLWVANIGREGHNFSLNSYLCQVHFTSDQWENGHLKKTAVPTFFCRCPRKQPLQLRSDNTDHQYHLSGRHAVGKENSSNQKRGRPAKDRNVEHVVNCPLSSPSPQNVRNALRDIGNVQAAPAASSTPVASRPALPPSSVDVVNLPPGSFVRSSSSTPQNLRNAPHDIGNVQAAPAVSSTPVASSPALPPVSVDVNDLPLGSCLRSSSSTPQNLRNAPHDIGNVQAAPAASSTPVASCPALPPVGVDVINLAQENALLRAELKATKRRLQQTTNLLNKTHGAVVNSRHQRDEFKTMFSRLEEKFKAFQSNLLTRFGEDQLDALSRGGNLRGSAWTDKTMVKAFRIHFSCGTTGYEVVSEEQMPLPSLRVKRQRLQNIHFTPGVLTHVYQFFPSKTKFFTKAQSEAMLGTDEMALRAAKEADVSTNTYVGFCTLPRAKLRFTKKEDALFFNNDPAKIEEERKRVSLSALNTLATKAMVFVLGGIQARWKQTVGYHFTGGSYCPETVRHFVIEILRRTHECGVTVRTLVGDMGNRSLWTAFGIDVGPKADKFWVPHPIDPQLRFYVMPDTVHLYKNGVEMLRSNKIIRLPVHLVEKYRLPSEYVRLVHLTQLCRFQEKMRWKYAPSLNEDLLQVNHFAKMRVRSATDVFNPRVAAALKFLSYLPIGEPGMRTTAWFISTFHRWFQIVSARSPIHGLGKKNPDAFKSAMELFDLILDLFQNMKVGEPVEWKTGVKAATLILKDLAGIYLDEMKFDFFLCGRTTNDICENCFSYIRIGNPIPTPLTFQRRLKTCSVSQFMKRISKSSYEFDDRTELVSFFRTENLPIPEDLFGRPLSTVQEEDDEEPILASLSIARENGIPTMQHYEKFVFYRVCGYVMCKLFKESHVFSDCTACLDVCTYKGEKPHPYGQLLRMTNFKENCLFEVSDAAFLMLVNVEELIAAVEPSLKNLKADVIKFLENKVCDVEVPPQLKLLCHPNLAKAITHRYVRFRFKFGSDKPSMKRPAPKSADMSSMSTGSRHLAKNYNPSKRRKKE